jgi:hypothetical protein
VNGVSTSNEVLYLYERAGGKRQELPEGEPVRSLWRLAIDGLAAHGGIQRLCELLLDYGPTKGNKDFERAVLGIVDAVSVAEMQVYDADGVVILDRGPLRTNLAKLEIDDHPLNVLVVRGAPKTGKTHGRYLFERVANIHGVKVAYLFEGGVTTVEEAIRTLFSHYGAVAEVPPPDTTQEAWYRAVLDQLHSLAVQQQKALWIAVDDIGPGPDGVPRIDPEIRTFCEQFATRLRNPSFAQWFRLMLMHYDRDPAPTTWTRELWAKDTTSDDDVKRHHVEEYIRAWVTAQDLNVPDTQVSSLVDEVMEKCDGPAPPGAPLVPRLQRLSEAVEAALDQLGGEPS